VSVVVFDVNETLLDLGALDGHFERLFGEAEVRKEWFGLVLRNALTLTTLGDYSGFTEVGAASLAMVAAVRGVSLADEDRDAIGRAMVSLPPHPDVVESLERLRAHSRLAALTNSPQEAAEAQLTNADISGYFERIMSVEAVGKFKPAREVYEMAAHELGTGDLILVAAHDWDVAGAMHAGWRGAFVTRPGMTLNPLFPPPSILGPDLQSITDQLLASA
jgi:2-haloacid dehalogenase